MDAEITLEDIRKAVFHQKNGKSSGPDGISSEIIKSSIEIIAPYLYILYNKLFNDCVYHESWGWGYIVPIFKSGDPTQSKNYRGITLNNILSKIYSQILLNRLTKWNEEHETISECQVGYQKGKVPYTACFYYIQSLQTF